MIELNEKKTNCCGCAACAQSCPQNCIKMETDGEGFLYPVIDKSSCVECGLCEKVCPVIDHEKIPDGGDNKYPMAAGGWHSDDTVRAASSSGGAFSLFAEEILKQCGVVYGCALDENMEARHIRVDSSENLDKLRGSKYVQSRTEDIYSDIKEQLGSGKKVLFSGTPCQAAGLYSFLGKRSYDDLYVIDFICHGVPSPRVFKEYINDIEKRSGSRVIGFKFRLKDHGWNSSGLQLGTEAVFEDGKKVRKYPGFKDAFMNGFLEDTYLRPSCYECSFKEIRKNYSDFTIADFWGVNKVTDGLDDGKGTSLILIHNEHAKKLWETVSPGFTHKDVSLTEALKYNGSIDHSVTRRKNRETFFSDLDSKGFNNVRKKYMSAFIWAWHRLWRMFGKYEQFMKFALVGLSNTFVSLAVYYICIFFGMHYMLAYTLGFLVSVCNAFFWNNRYVFINKQEKSLVKAFIKVLTSYGFSFILSLVLMGILVDMLKIPQVIAPLLKMIVTIPINFVLNKVWAFKDRVRLDQE